MNRAYYSEYKSIKTDLTNKEKDIRNDIKTLELSIGDDSKAIAIKNKIIKDLQSFKDLVDQLHEAYKTINAPPNMPDSILVERQKVIDDFRVSFNSMKKALEYLTGDTYSFKDIIKEDYNDKDEKLDQIIF